MDPHLRTSTNVLFLHAHRKLAKMKTKQTIWVERQPEKKTWIDAKKKTTLQSLLVDIVKSPDPTPPSSKLVDVLLGGSLGKLKALCSKSR